MKDLKTQTYGMRNNEKLHWHIQHWKLDLQFLEDETTFIEKLLNSDIFEPNRPNQFERLQGYMSELDKFKARKTKLRQLISKHENRLGDIMESEDPAIRNNFYHRHDDLEMEVLSCTDDYRNLKANIFNYVGGTLKKRETTY